MAPQRSNRRGTLLEVDRAEGRMLTVKDVQDAPMSKQAYFLKHRAAAREALEQGVEVFSEGNALLKELRTVFDWMAQERHATKINKRDFQKRLPEIHRKFPKLSTSFARMDLNNDCWLEWEEFVSFCLQDRRMEKAMQRQCIITVYGLDEGGSRMYKDIHDPTHMCETGTPPPLLPWEMSHVVEWRIEGLGLSHRGCPVTYAGMVVRSGACIASPPFRAAGACGFLRFWPAGFFTETSRRKKASLPPGPADPAPSSDAWCCIGASMPTATHLKFRFFIGDGTLSGENLTKSSKRECFWSEGTHVGQIWAPPATDPPAALRESSHIIVGMEIYQNCAVHQGTIKTQRDNHTVRHNRRPALGKTILDGDPVVGSVLLGKSASLPLLKPKRARSPKGNRSVLGVSTGSEFSSLASSPRSRAPPPFPSVYRCND